jgi:methylenetetrahydrofolate dehydrogenase (NADP+) / methenyltetrahydrofolate cyclohydrolase
MAESNLIDGRAIAEQIHAETARRISALASHGVQPGLAFVRVGEDPASVVYVGMKEKISRRLNLASSTHVRPETASENDLLELLAQLNADPAVHGILVQAPLPPQIDPTHVYAAVQPDKDVDGFHPVNIGKLLLGDSSGFVPCTPAGVHELLVRSGVKLDGADVVILGRGNIVGKPLAALLLQKAPHCNATVTICHSRSRHIPSHCARADIVVAAIGSPKFLKADMIKTGAVVIDVGVNRVPDPQARGGSRLVGDVDFDAVQPLAGQITPNPGGVGPMTIAMLMRNTVRAAEQTLDRVPHRPLNHPSP